MDNFTKRLDVSDYSLDIIKATIKTIKATSSEREELRNDLQYIVDTIETNIKVNAIECNKRICLKYQAIFDVAQNYELCRISDAALEATPQTVQIVILHRIAHYLRDCLKTETIKVKGKVALDSAAEFAVDFSVRQLFK